MTWIDFTCVAAIGVLLTALACADARRFRIDIPVAVALAATGLAWHAETPSHLGLVSTAWWMPLAGLAAGAGVVAIIIAAAELARRPWPIMPGDGILLAAAGAVVGPLGLAWSLIAACPATLAYRFCLQAKRSRPLLRGYVPFAPGLAAGVGAVLVLLACGAAVAGDDDVITAREADTLAAVVLAPVAEPGPPGAAGEIVFVDTGQALTLPETAARLEAATGRRIVIEERPSRTGVTAVLETAAPQAIEWDGSATGLFDLVAAGHGYRWEWRGEAVVFYRYWDDEFLSAVTGQSPHHRAWWEIDRDRHPTLKAVFESWAGEAGWTLAWTADADFALGADAVFEGSFLGAVDAVLADPATAARLVATAYRENRQLVIEEAQ